MWTTGRRRFQRYPASLPITFTIRERHITGKCNQIAEGGLGASLRRAIPVGSVVSLQFAVPAPAAKLRVQGVVRYKTGRQYGVEFLSLSEAERLAIRQFCSNLPAIGPEA
jgi:c-di-GMP-binding flagellar brake protein YcgR